MFVPFHKGINDLKTDVASKNDFLIEWSLYLKSEKHIITINQSATF